jgi:hypothetical protein
MNDQREATVTPRPDGETCEQIGCDETELLASVNPDTADPARTLCPTHRVAYLREVYYQ